MSKMDKKCNGCKKILQNNNFVKDDNDNTLYSKCLKCRNKLINKKNFCNICGTRASFNFIGEILGINCSKHKEPTMIDIKNKKCQKCQTKRPVFNYIGETIALFCGDCKEPTMIDIKSKKCDEKGCRKHAICNFPGVLPKYCVSHIREGMTRNPRKKCNIEDCNEMCVYGIQEPLHCEKHKTEDDYNLCERRCSNCNKIDILNRNGICINFCSLDEIDRVVKKRVKKHEEFICKLLDAEIDIETYSKDSVEDSYCGKYRPDVVYHLGTHIVIVEVDEDQHKSYRCTAYGDDIEGRKKGENIRMFSIFQSFQTDDIVIPCIFLRYNPDRYKNDIGKIVKIAKGKREDILIRWVRRCIRDISLEGLKIKYICYDGFNETSEDIESIDLNRLDEII